VGITAGETPSVGSGVSSEFPTSQGSAAVAEAAVNVQQIKDEVILNSAGVQVFSLADEIKGLPEGVRYYRTSKGEGSDSDAYIFRYTTPEGKITSIDIEIPAEGFVQGELKKALERRVNEIKSEIAAENMPLWKKILRGIGIASVDTTVENPALVINAPIPNEIKDHLAGLPPSQSSWYSESLKIDSAKVDPFFGKVAQLEGKPIVLAGSDSIIAAMGLSKPIEQGRATEVNLVRSNAESDPISGTKFYQEVKIPASGSRAEVTLDTLSVNPEGSNDLDTFVKNANEGKYLIDGHPEINVPLKHSLFVVVDGNGEATIYFRTPQDYQNYQNKILTLPDTANYPSDWAAKNPDAAAASLNYAAVVYARGKAGGWKFDDASNKIIQEWAQTMTPEQLDNIKTNVQKKLTDESERNVEIPFLERQTGTPAGENAVDVDEDKIIKSFQVVGSKPLSPTEQLESRTKPNLEGAYVKISGGRLIDVTGWSDPFAVTPNLDKVIKIAEQQEGTITYLHTHPTASYEIDRFSSVFSGGDINNFLDRPYMKSAVVVDQNPITGEIIGYHFLRKTADTPVKTGMDSAIFSTYG